MWTLLEQFIVSTIFMLAINICVIKIVSEWETDGQTDKLAYLEFTGWGNGLLEYQVIETIW